MVLLVISTSFVVSQNNYDSGHLTQGAYHDSDEGEPYPTSGENQPVEYESHEEAHSGDPRNYQSLEPKHHQPQAYSTQYFRQYPETPHHETQVPAKQPHHYGTPEHIEYNQPEDPSYHRPQEIVHHQPPEHHQSEAPRHDESYRRPNDYHHQDKAPRHDESYRRPNDYHHQDESPRHGESYHRPNDYHHQPDHKDDGSNYKVEEPKYTHVPRQPSPPQRGLVPTDPKLPLYFTMYEKRTIQDPLNKYGKGPWRYLTYGHGISYGTKGPGKVFEKGYGYIRALGRDHCKLPEHLCPPTEEKPFEYEGRKEPYFGYRPH